MGRTGGLWGYFIVRLYGDLVFSNDLRSVSFRIGVRHELSCFEVLFFSKTLGGLILHKICLTDSRGKVFPSRVCGTYRPEQTGQKVVPFLVPTDVDEGFTRGLK